MKSVLRCGWLVAALAAAGCQPAPPPTDDAVAQEDAVPALPAEAPQVTGTAEELRQRATQALSERRVHAPAGDNAVEYFLAARMKRPDDADVQNALVELQPYLLIAAEQALERADIPESRRLLALIVRADPRAPALPRLRSALREAQERAAQLARQESEAAKLAAQPAASPAPSVSPPPPAVSTPAVTSSSTRESTAASVPTPSTTMVASAPPAVDSVAMASATPAAPPSPRTPAARAPRLVQDAAPRYPLPALRGKIEGQAEVAFTIQPDGSVRNVQLVSSTPLGVFDDSAVAVASRWRFEATGQAHSSRRTVLFRLPH